MKRKSSIFVSERRSRLAGGIFFPFSANFIPRVRGKRRKEKEETSPSNMLREEDIQVGRISFESVGQVH